jgi:lambda family phage portal protein
MRILGLEITRAAKQQPGRRRRTNRRGFDAAKIDRLTSDWVTTPRSADAELYGKLSIMRARARDLAHNDDYAKRFLQMVKTNVIGARGIAMACRARYPSGDLDAFANRLIEAAWKQWGKPGVCTLDGRLSWLDAQNLFIETAARDGEALVRFVEPYAGNRFGFALEFIDPDYLDERKNEALRGGGEIRLGVEYDAAGRVAAYHLKKDYPGGDLHGGLDHARNHRRIPAGEILHAYRLERARQGRGFPWMAASLRRLKMLAGYEQAELVAARVGAAKMGFFIESEEAGQGETLEDEFQPIMEAEPGTFESLPYGTEFQEWSPDHPANAYEPYVLSVLRGAASGLGVSYTSLANDLRSVSYSSIRQGTIEERDHWRALQAWVVEHFCAPVFERWLEASLRAVDLLPLPFSKFEKFNAAIWRPRGWPWVDPLKEVKAQKEAVANGFKSLQDVAAEGGVDIEDVFEALSQEKELAQSYGLNLASLPQAQGGSDGKSQ